MSVKAPSDYARISMHDINQCKTDKHSSYIDGKELRHLMAKNNLPIDFAIPEGEISVSKAQDVLKQYTQEKFENDILNGHYRVSKAQADEILRTGSNALKSVVLAMNENYATNAGEGSYSACRYIA